ncbi:MAG: hypothetical protein ACKERG_02525 [Candidatus Hodgkinia cicadicola]
MCWSCDLRRSICDIEQLLGFLNRSKSGVRESSLVESRLGYIRVKSGCGGGGWVARRGAGCEWLRMKIRSTVRGRRGYAA